MKLTVKPRTIIAAVLGVFLLVGAVLGVLVWQAGQGPSPENPSNNSSNPGGSPSITTNYYEKSSLDSGIVDQQRELLNYYKNANASITVKIDKSGAFTKTNVYNYKLDYANDVYVMNATGPEKEVSAKATTKSVTYTKYPGGGIQGDAKPFDSLSPVNTELGSGAQLIEYSLGYERTGTGKTNGYKYVEFTNKKQGAINIPFSDINPTSYSSVESQVRIDSNNVVRYIKTTARVTGTQGTYRVTITYQLHDYNTKSYSLPTWTNKVNPAPDLCAQGVEPIAEAKKYEKAYSGRFGIKTLGDAKSVTIVVNGNETKTLTEPGSSVTGAFKPTDKVKLVATGQSGCERVIGEYTISELADNS